MKKIVFILIIFLASFLRFYDLAGNPPSVYWDEASIGYNAFSILKTGADEYGNYLPASFRSFDDYKPPLYIYLTVPSIALFGLNEFAIRFPSALFGVLSVIISYFLVKEIFLNKNLTIKIRSIDLDVPLLSMIIIAISPWHLQFSRAAFEANVGLFFALTGLLFFLKGLRKDRMFILSSVFFALSLYTYHSFRIITPLTIIAASILLLPRKLKSNFCIYAFFLIFFVSVVPIALSLLTGSGAGSRLSQVTIFNVPDLLSDSISLIETDNENKDFIGSIFHNRRLIYFFEIIKGYFDHTTVNFLFLNGDSSRHHHVVGMGTLFLFELPALLFGIFQLIKIADRRITLLFILLLVAPLPSAITTGTPHAVRAIFMLFPLHVISSYGMIYILRHIISFKRVILRSVSLFILASFMLTNLFYYLHQYYIHTPIEYGDFWQYGYKELYQKLNKYESNYNKIIITYEYDHPDTYYLLYNKIDPNYYQMLQKKQKVGINRFESKIGKYHFKKIDWEKDKLSQDTLLIVTPGEAGGEVAGVIDEVKFLNGQTAFKIIEGSDETSKK